MSDLLFEAMQRAGWGGDPGDLQSDSSQDEPQSLHIQKVMEEVRQLRIRNETALNNLIPKSQAKAIISRYGEIQQVYFVQMPRREAANICAALGIEGQVKTLENILNGIIEKGLDACRNELKNIKGDLIWK